MKNEQIEVVGKKEFDNFADAQELYDVLDEEGFEYLSILSNTPTTGQYSVSWGHRRAASADELFRNDLRGLGRALDDREQHAQRKYTEACDALGRQTAAKEMAATAGYKGRDAEIFIAGFCGESAKRIDPRRDGREAIFRAGRTAWGSKEGQQAWRIAAVKARSILKLDLLHTGVVINTEAS